MKSRSTLRFILEGIEGVVLMSASVLAWPVAHSWLRDWGSTAEERERSWPGDDLVACTAIEATRAIELATSPDRAWQHIVQLGLGRAGFYSYELLERLAGIPVRNIESIESGWQHLAVGDGVLLHPTAGLRVSKLEHGRSICFGEQIPAKPDADDRSWSLYVEPRSPDSCRLVIRSCIGEPSPPTRAKAIAIALEQPIDFVMEQRMLRTIKRLCERSVQEGVREVGS